MIKVMAKKIIFYEILGFIFVIIMLWLDEIFDFPHILFQTPMTPVNWSECILESIIIIILACSVIFTTRRLLNKIKYLEGFLPVCSFCKKIRCGNEWIPIERYITDNSEAEFTHSFCPPCAEKHYGVTLSETRESL